MTGMGVEILDTEGLTPEDYRKLTGSFVADEQPANDTGISEKPHRRFDPNSLEKLGLSKHSIHVTRMAYLWGHTPTFLQTFALVIQLLQYIVTLIHGVSLLNEGIYIPVFGNWRLYIRVFRNELLAGVGPVPRLPLEIIFACLNYIVFFVHRGLLIESVTFVFSFWVFLVMLAIDEHHQNITSGAYKFNFTTSDTNGPTRDDAAVSATRVGRLG